MVHKLTYYFWISPKPLMRFLIKDYCINSHIMASMNLCWIKNHLSNRQQKVTLDGASSRSLQIISGVPQGSVLGSLLFLFYINDLPTEISSTIWLYANDAIIYRPIVSTEDVRASTSTRYRDIGTMGQGLVIMTFNLSKCKHLLITNKHSRILSDYNINGYIINKVSSSEYLGVTITNNLSWSKHIINVVNNANSVRGFLQRNLRQCSTSVKPKAYLAFVRPIVEYASAI